MNVGIGSAAVDVDGYFVEMRAVSTGVSLPASLAAAYSAYCAAIRLLADTLPLLQANNDEQNDDAAEVNEGSMNDR